MFRIRNYLKSIDHASVEFVEGKMRASASARSSTYRGVQLTDSANFLIPLCLHVVVQMEYRAADEEPRVRGSI